MRSIVYLYKAMFNSEFMFYSKRLCIFIGGVYYMLTDSVSGLEMDLLSDNCGQNIVRNGNTAKWIDKTAHIFRSSTNISPGKYKFVYFGTGHASVGVGQLLDDGHMDWIFRANIHCKKEHGNGSVVFSRSGRLSVELHGKEEGFVVVVPALQSLYLFFDIRFGNFSFCAKETKLISLSPNGKAITDNGDTKIDLCHKNSGAFCVVQNPVTADKDIELSLNSASNPQYWHIKLRLSNSSPESNGNCTSSCYLKRFKNSKGTIRVAMKTTGEVFCSFKDQTITANTENLHLSQPIYLWLELYRCQVKIKSNNTSEKVTMAYIKINENQPHTVAMSENHVGFAECRRPHEENYNDAVPVVLKSPRLQIQERIDDEDETEPKILADNSNQELQQLTQMVSLAIHMKNTDSRSHYDSMFKNIRTALLERLVNLENNHTISEVVLINMRHSIETLQFTTL